MGSRIPAQGFRAKIAASTVKRRLSASAAAAAAKLRENCARMSMSEALESRTLLSATIVGGGTFPTIQGAVNAASAGAVINVDPGTYTELVTVNKSLTIKGAQFGVDARSNTRQAGANESVLNVANAATSGFNITASDVTIDGFTIQGNSGIPNSEAGIVIAPNQSGTHIVNNIITNNVAGMYLANASSTDGAVIQHNVFSVNNQPGTNGGRGIYTDGGIAGSALQNVSIDGNYFYQNLGGTGTTGLEAAISFEARAIMPTNIGITNNTFEDNGKALLAINISNLTITGNIITDSQDHDSGALRFEGGAANVTIQNNNIYYNLASAIRMDSKGFAADNTGFTITSNNIYGNGYYNLANPSPGVVSGSVVLAPGTYGGPGPVASSNNYWGAANGPSGDGAGSGDVLVAGGNSYTYLPVSATPIPPQSTPFDGLAAVPDSTIQASNFDQGGKGVGFLVGTGSVNSNGNYRETVVPMETTADPGGSYSPAYDVTGLTTGQWLTYTINVPSAGTYKLDYRVASAQATGGTFHATLDGATVGGTMTMPNTGSGQTWQTISSPSFSVTAGTHVIKLLVDTNGSGGTIGNFHWLRLTTVTTGTVPTAPAGLTATAASGQITLSWTNTATNQTGFQIDKSTNGTTFNPLTTVGANVTNYSDMAVTAGTTYYYRVEATNAAGASPSSNIANAVAAAAPSQVYVSDLTWVSGTTGFGSIGIDKSVNGNPLKLRGTTYPKGLGVHAVSQIVYNIGGQYSNFVSDIGVDDEEIGNPASIIFQILGDANAVLYTSPTLTPASAVVHVNISVAGVQQLTLVVNNGVAGIDFDHGDWAGAQLLQLPPAPTALTATAAVAGGINLAWTNNATNQTGFEVDRSTNGTTFALLTNTVAANATTFSDLTTTPGTSYFYRVEAIGTGGLSAASNIANATALKFNPIYSGLTASQAITYGAATTTLAGTIKNGTLIPTGNVTVTVNGVAALAAINQTTGAFTINYNTLTLPASVTPYTITYSYAGDTRFSTGSDTTTALTVNQRALHIIATGVAKTYDGLTSATVTYTDDRINSDVFTDAAASALFADKNVGVGKAVTITGLTITGVGAGNYSLAATTAAATANITVRTLHITPTGVAKVYDGLLTDTITETDDRVINDVLTLGYTANFADKNVGAGKTVSITGMNLTGTDAIDYVLSATTGSSTANITAKTLTVTATGVNKVYDGLTAGSVTLTDNHIAGDAVTTAFTTATFADKNVGTAKVLSVSGISMSGAGIGNYTLGNTTATASANITARALTVTATGVNKVYDHTTTASVTLADNHIGSDVVTATAGAAAFVDKQAGNAKTINVTGITISGADAGNYTVAGTAIGTANITPKTLTVTATGADKVYNGNTTATITTVDDRISGDVFTVAYTANFADKNVGNNKTINVTAINLTGTDAIDYTPGATTASTSASITPKTLTFTATGVNKVYDGLATATVTLTDNRVSGDLFTDSASTASFADKNAGTNRVISVGGMTIVGVDSGNYLFSSSTTATANITVRPLAVTATAASKVYDGTTSATATLADNRLSGDVLTPNYTTSLFVNKNVGLGKTVTISGITLSGTDALNYAPNATTTATADITQHGLTVSAVGVNKIYDGLTTGTVTFSDTRVSGDVFTDSASSITFADKNVGTGKAVSVSGITISGADAANYSAPNTTASTTANITQRALTVSATGIDKIYDGLSTAAVTLSDNRVSGDILTATNTTSNFINKNVGTAKAVSVSGIAVTGADAANYTFNVTATATASITPRALLVTATGIDKVYNGTTTASVTLADNRLAGDVFTDSNTAANFVDKNVGVGKTINVSGIAIAGTDFANYSPNTTTTGTASITPRALTVTATGVNKVYDGLTTGTATLADNRVSGDVFTDSATGVSFVDKNVGTAKAVSVSGITISGTDAANYQAPNPTTSTTANITQRALTVTATGVNKIYDGLTTAGVTLTDNRVSGDTLTASNTTSTFADKNVGTAKPISVSGIVLSGADAANYTFNATATTTANITQRALLVTATGADKVYNATTTASITLADNRVTGDVFTDSSTSSNFVDKNVGSGKSINVAGISVAGTDAGNYAAPNSTTTATASITPRILTISATGSNKVYDTTTTASVALTDNRVTGDVFTDSFGAASFANKNVGVGKSISVSGITVLGADAGNYVINTTATATANVTAASVTGSVTAAAKVYDGTTVATLSTRSLTGALGVDVVTLTGGTATFDTKNVGTGKTVTATGFTVGGADGANYTLSNPSETTTANITAASVTGSVTASAKTYDATTTATLATRSLTGVFGVDVVTLNGGAATFDTKNVGIGKTVTATGLTIGGADATNYVLSNLTATTTANVTAASLSGSVTAANKVYDTTTAASLLTRSLTGILGTDAVSLSGGTASFDTKNIGTGKTVTATGLTLAGIDAGNYALASPSATTLANITPVTLADSITTANKPYDSTTSATILTRNLTGVLGTDSVTLTGGTATFNTKNVGIGKAVSSSGLTLTGLDAGNYVLANPTPTATANITPLSISGSINAAGKVYDRTVAATITNPVLTGMLVGDVVGLTGGTATFDTKDVGIAKTVTATGLVLSGADAGNYTLSNPTENTTADITALALNGSFAAFSKAYDTTTSAAIASRNLTGVLAGDAVTMTGGTATFDSKNAGIGKTVTATGLTLTGADSGNYSLFNPTETTTASVSTVSVSGNVTVGGKIYDGTTAATLQSRTLTGILGTDVVSLTGGTATFDTKAAGAAKSATVTGLTLAGTDGGNYALSNPTETATALIAQASLTASTLTAASKTYDSTSLASILTASLNGVIGTDAVSLTGSASFDSKNVGTGKTVTATGLGLSGADGGNYSLLTSTLTTTANITRASLTGSITAASKPYDGTTSASFSAGALIGVLGSDVVSLSGGSASFDTKNIGSAKTVTATGLVLSGPDSGNYTLLNPTETATAAITPLRVLNGTAAVDDLRLSMDGDGVDIDWAIFVAGNPVQVGQLSATDAAGLTINGQGGNDTIGLDYSHGNPLPGMLHLNGAFTINGLSSSPLALANTQIELGASTVYFSYAPGQSPVSLIQQALAKGYNAGSWTGSPTASVGSITSANAAAGATGNLGIGYADSADGFVVGQPVNTVEVRYTVMGDANLDRVVNGTDAVQLARNYNNSINPGWDQGNFNYDGSVNMADAVLLQKNFNATASGAAVAALAPVTPPSVLPAAGGTSSGASSSSTSSSSSSASGSAGVVAVVAAPVVATPTVTPAPVTTTPAMPTIVAAPPIVVTTAPVNAPRTPTVAPASATTPAAIAPVVIAVPVATSPIVQSSPVVTATASVTPTIVAGVTQIPIVDSTGPSEKSKHHAIVKPAMKPKAPVPLVHKPLVKKHK